MGFLWFLVDLGLLDLCYGFVFCVVGLGLGLSLGHVVGLLGLCCGFGFGSCCGVAGFLTDVGLLGLCLCLCLCLWWWCHRECFTCLKTVKNR